MTGRDVDGKRGAGLEVAAVASAVVLSLTLESGLGLGATVWSPAYDLAWQLPLLSWLRQRAKLRGEGMASFSRPLTRSSVWDIALLFILLLLTYAATFQVVSAFAPELAHHAWRGSSAVTRGPWALPALTLAIVAPITSELLFRGHLQTRLTALGLPAPAVVVSSAFLQASLLLDWGGVTAIAFAAEFIVLAQYYQRTRNLWPVVIAHAMQSGIGLAALSRTVF